MLPNPQFPADLVIFTGEILNVKVHFCEVRQIFFVVSILRNIP